LHGAGRASVRVRYGATAVDLEVADDGRLLGAGPPIGLRERVALYGGELSAAPRRDGGHVVRARLPREVPA
jgi:signal transduction histidine kinase